MRGSKECHRDGTVMTQLGLQPLSSTPGFPEACFLITFGLPTMCEENSPRGHEDGTNLSVRLKPAAHPR